MRWSKEQDRRAAHDLLMSICILIIADVSDNSLHSACLAAKRGKRGDRRGANNHMAF